MPNRSSSRKQNGCSICSLSAFSTCAICTLLLQFLPMFTRHCVCSFLLCSLCSAKLNFSHVFSLSLSLLSLCLSHSPTICFLFLSLSICFQSSLSLSLSHLSCPTSLLAISAPAPLVSFKWCYFFFWWLFAGRRSILRLLVLASWFLHIFLGGCLVVFVFFFFLSLYFYIYIYIYLSLSFSLSLLRVFFLACSSQSTQKLTVPSMNRLRFQKKTKWTSQLLKNLKRALQHRR